MQDYLVFDLETQRSAADVGGWDKTEEMKMSVGVLWDSKANRFFTYYEDQVADLIKHLKSGPTVIGYNHISFDYKVLLGYYPVEAREGALKEFHDLKNLDLLNVIKDTIGKRIRLEDAARPTLKVGKSADGLLALQWYKEFLAGDQEKLGAIADYCRQDVAVTRDLFIYGQEHKHIYYLDKGAGITKVDIQWETEKDTTSPGDDAEQLSLF
ncbi:MAG: ribonuclease H-like domain-containing protein [SAR324 cluster bacterium]|nr:ribonuclease H-like domain-containing protein [SAR324 cluster bacterium]